jgi:hypothetical protein
MNRTTHHLGVILLGSSLALSHTLQAENGPGGNGQADLAREMSHVIAWVPRSQAPTAGVAQALVHLHLDRALRAAEAEHCNGAWQLGAPRPRKSQPVAVSAPQPLGAEPAWHYRLSQVEVKLDRCPGVEPAEFQRSVSRHLPDWMLIQPAYHLTLLQQGQVVMPYSYLPARHYQLAGL